MTIHLSVMPVVFNVKRGIHTLQNVLNVFPVTSNLTASYSCTQMMRSRPNNYPYNTILNNNDDCYVCF